MVKNHTRMFMVAAASLAGCHQPQGQPARVQTIVIATDAAFPPFHWVEADGKITGHDVALARAVLKRAGYQHETVRVRPYSTLLQGLSNGSHQLVAATTGITAARERLYRFSRPYFQTCQAVVVRRTPDAPRRIAALNGRRVGAAGSGTSRAALDALQGVEPVAVASAEAGLQALLNGEIDGYIVDEYEAVAFARADAERLMVLSEPLALESYGFAMPLDQPLLQQRVNAALTAMLEDGSVALLQREFELERGPAWPVKFDTNR